MTSDGLVERASTFLFAVKEFGDVATRAINERVGKEYSGNVVVATLGALARGDVQRPLDLESLTGASSATVARTLDLLEQRGDIVRLAHADPDDGRATLLQLTEQGRQVEREIARALVSSLDHIREWLRAATDLLDPIDDPAHRRRRGAPLSIREGSAIADLGKIGGILIEILTSALDDLEVNAALTLCLLHRSDGPVRPITVSTLFGLTTGATSKLIDRMETAGFVQRSYGRIAEDRRGVEVSSTTIGDSRLALIATKIFDRSTEIAHAFRLFEDLDDELAASRLS